MTAIWNEILRILNESSVYLLVGFLLAGLINVLLARYRRITSLLTASGGRSVVLAAILGMPLPLCSCSVLPTALTLRRQGASKGATASFLVSVPETDIISIVLTLALLGPIMAVARPVAAMATAIVTGFVANRVDAWAGGARQRVTSGSTGKDATDAPSTDHLEPARGIHEKTVVESPPKRRWPARVIHFGFVEMFDDIVGQLAIGIILAGVIVVWLPGFRLESIVSGSPLTYLVMLAIGIPVYVCATASTPLAVGLIAGGVSPGAALVFLLAGPATNIASLLVLGRQFGRRVLVGYISSIAVVSVIVGVLFDRLLGPATVMSQLSMPPMAEETTSVIQIVASIVFVTLLVLSFRRTRQPLRWIAKFATRFRLSDNP
ncbi:MAG: SO_0444 family Cu/Zn efflux transporter [Candidatus Latescibacterota bacterium]|nr:MAG: SO_0444 family Cu/Zn efflux transporter [Candidatus Latescibacterota bacterium]